jgi:hypothetical protein
LVSRRLPHHCSCSTSRLAAQPTDGQSGMSGSFHALQAWQRWWQCGVTTHGCGTQQSPCTTAVTRVLSSTAHHSPSKFCVPVCHPNQLTARSSAGRPDSTSTSLPPRTVSAGGTCAVPAAEDQGEGQAMGMREPSNLRRHVQAFSGGGGGSCRASEGSMGSSVCQ